MWPSGKATGFDPVIVGSNPAIPARIFKEMFGRKKIKIFKAKVRKKLRENRQETRKRIEYCETLNKENTEISLKIQAACDDKEKIQDRCTREIDFANEKIIKYANKNASLIKDIQIYKDNIEDLKKHITLLEQQNTKLKQFCSCLELEKERLKILKEE